MKRKVKNAGFLLLMLMVILLLAPASAFAADDSTAGTEGDAGITTSVEAEGDAGDSITEAEGDAGDSITEAEGDAEDATGADEENAPDAETPTAPNAAASAVSTASKVLVNGTEISFDAYNIDGYNYFKLRDLAKAVTGTEKQFDVAWDAETNAINLVSGQTYTEVGGELAAGDGETKDAILSTSKIYKDGSEAVLTAYNINGNNYFKLRDLAATFNIGVTWDAATNTVGIDTAQSYEAEE